MSDRNEARVIKIKHDAGDEEVCKVISEGKCPCGGLFITVESDRGKSVLHSQPECAAFEDHHPSEYLELLKLHSEGSL